MCNQPHKFLLTQRVSFYFNHTTTTEIYTLSLHDALPISRKLDEDEYFLHDLVGMKLVDESGNEKGVVTDEIGRATSELQSRRDLVCRLLLEKKKNYTSAIAT